MTTRTKEEWAAEIAAYKASGVTQTQFARERGIDVRRFNYHLLRAQGGDSKPEVARSAPKLLPIQVLKKHEKERVEVTLPNGARISFMSEIGVESMRQLFSMLGQ
jgi:hypothetical protein